MGINSEVKAQKIFRNIGYRGLALVSLLLGAIGVVLPGLPTVPFILLAGWSAQRGWPSLAIKLRQNSWTGPILLRWQEHREIPRQVKLFATMLMLISVIVFWMTFSPLVAAIFSCFVFLGFYLLWFVSN
ncbi:MAG: YbaN family protein [Gammaproteobacteria bacterium]|nr:YbaN family protein [Gammaproteobacteria bacterium]